MFNRTTLHSCHVCCISWTYRTCTNEKLYSWTFNFHKVVQQQNSGAVEDFILPYSAVYLRIQKWKNYWKLTFAKVIVKIKVAPFYGPRYIYTRDGRPTSVFENTYFTFFFRFQKTWVFTFFWNDVSKDVKSQKKYQVCWMSIEILASKLPDVMGIGIYHTQFSVA